jgi:organic hydroperoxide reductase OsmC/OhrA
MNESEPKKLRVNLSREEGFRFRVRFEREGMPELMTDEPPPLGQGTGPNPSLLLGTAVANCLASSLLFCLQRSRVEVGSLEAEVEISMIRNEQGRFRIPSIGVRLAPVVSPEAAEKMERCRELFESFCVVTESVRKGIEVGVTVEPRTS